MKKVAGLLMAVLLMMGSTAQAEDYAAKVQASMAMLKSKAVALGVARIEGDSLFFGSEEMNGNYDIVDEVTDVHEGTATIFAKKDADFVRIATNVIKEGKRAVGTKLDPNGPVYPLIQKGESFYGAVDILGSQYQTGYEPVKDVNGAVVGILYVGYKL